MNLFGTSLIQDKGMTFDGTGTFATAVLPRHDCLRDPGLCVYGFSIGSRIKFDQADMAYTIPKYIFDSGARSLTTRGVSVYVVKGNLFFELATANKAWKVRRWFEVQGIAYILVVGVEGLKVSQGKK